MSVNTAGPYLSLTNSDQLNAKLMSESEEASQALESKIRGHHIAAQVCIPIGLTLLIFGALASVFIGKHMSLTNGLISGGAFAGSLLLTAGISHCLDKQATKLEKQKKTAIDNLTEDVTLRVARFFSGMFESRQDYVINNLGNNLHKDANGVLDLAKSVATTITKYLAEKLQVSEDDVKQGIDNNITNDTALNWANKIVHIATKNAKTDEFQDPWKQCKDWTSKLVKDVLVVKQEQDDKCNETEYEYANLGIKVIHQRQDNKLLFKAISSLEAYREIKL